MASTLELRVEELEATVNMLRVYVPVDQLANKGWSNIDEQVLKQSRSICEQILDETKTYVDDQNTKVTTKLENSIHKNSEKTKNWCTQAITKDIGTLKQAAA